MLRISDDIVMQEAVQSLNIWDKECNYFSAVYFEKDSGKERVPSLVFNTCHWVG